MKKLPLFWKIYIFAVTVVILLICGFFVILSINLRKYEQTAEEDRRTRRLEAEAAEQSRALSEELREYEERDSAELAEATLPSRLAELIGAASSAHSAGRTFVSSSLDSTPEKIMDALVYELDKNGISAVRGVLSYTVGKYESEDSVISYIDSMEGRYAYEKTDELNYRLKKGAFAAAVELSSSRREDGRKTYALKKVSPVLPLITFRFQAPENAVVTLNGKPVTETPVMTRIETPDFVPASLSVPDCADYEITGLLSRPAVTALIDGRDCVRVNYPDKTVFLTPSADEYGETILPYLSELSFSYSDFVAGVFKFAEMKKYLWSKTKLYDTLASFDNRWYYNYDHIRNLDVKVTDLTVWSEQLVSAHIEYTQTLYDEKDKVRFRFPIKLDVFIGQTAGETPRWLLVNVE